SPLSCLRPRPVTRADGLPRLLLALLHWALLAALALVLLTGLFCPSYSRPPAHYAARVAAATASARPGRGNPANETVFVAASLYDPAGEVAGGAWGAAVLALIDLLGPERVFLSVYENNSGEAGQAALRAFAAQVPPACNKSIVYEPSMDVVGDAAVQSIALPDGSRRVKRIAYLAAVRNRALRPLDAADEGIDLPAFDKLLFVNDVVFSPLDAINLLFSTNVDDSTGAARYSAACAVDFINPFKFYDTFATRDLRGYSMGVPFYPWFSAAGRAESRQDVLAQRDAVRVRSCWGGMVAFDAAFFQRKSRGAANADVVRFRAEEDPYWDASECCLIHADLQAAAARTPSNASAAEPPDSAIYMNPYVRVAYDPGTLAWLHFARRFERLFSPAQRLVSAIAGLPRFNPRRTELAGDTVADVQYDGARWKEVERIAGPGGFCGRRGAQVMIEHPRKGEKNWEKMSIPDGLPSGR
ncbi:hypothetical protein KEM52_004226, partial [Ascosphaera acerosa]